MEWKMKEDKQTFGKLRNMTAIYLTSGEKILLLYRQGGRVVNNIWVASAGGHFEEGELSNAGACVLRELYEELQISEEMLTNLSLRYVTLRRMKNEIWQIYHFFAELKDANAFSLHSNEGKLQWFSLDEIEGLTLSYAAEYVLKHWLKTGRYTADVYGGMSKEDGMIFTELEVF